MRFMLSWTDNPRPYDGLLAILLAIAGSYILQKQYTEMGR